MRRVWLLGWLCLFLLGCSSTTDNIEQIIAFRSKLLQGAGCSFTAEITADYTQQLHTFKARCKSDNTGKLFFEMISPESIAGITGTLEATGGNLTFDDHALLFPMMADGRISPVSGPWVMLRALRSGYINGCGEEGDELMIHIDDTYNNDALQVIIRTDSNINPKSAEIYHQGNRILTILVEDFLIL